MKTFIRTLLLTFSVLFLLPAFAQAATIDIQRSPAPPQAVLNDGAHFINFTVTATYSSDAFSMPINLYHDTNANGVLDPGTDALLCQKLPPINGAPSPFVYSDLCGIANGAPVGEYFIRATYSALDDQGNDDPKDDEVVVEQDSSTNFYVSKETGNLTIVKFHDVNGNGVQDLGENNIPNWTFDIIAPDPVLGSAPYELTTGLDGMIHMPSAYVGSYIITEQMQDGWGNITLQEQVVGVMLGSDVTVPFANARFGRVCGTTYLDANGDGVRQPTELTGVSGIPSALMSGANTLNSMNTDAAGRFTFDNLLPIADLKTILTVPAGYRITGDLDGGVLGSIGPFALTSGQVLCDRDTGLLPIPVLELKKEADVETAAAGSVVEWSLTVKNVGLDGADDVVVEDKLPAGLVLTSAQIKALPKGVTFKGGKLIWSVGDLAVDEEKVLVMKTTVSGSVKDGTNIKNMATAEADNAEEVSARDNVVVTNDGSVDTDGDGVPDNQEAPTVTG